MTRAEAIVGSHTSEGVHDRPTASRVGPGMGFEPWNDLVDPRRLSTRERHIDGSGHVGVVVLQALTKLEGLDSELRNSGELSANERKHVVVHVRHPCALGLACFVGQSSEA